MNLPVVSLLGILIASIVIYRILVWDAERMWTRQEQHYRQRGIGTQRPTNWERTVAWRKLGAIAYVIGILVVGIVTLIRFS